MIIPISSICNKMRLCKDCTKFNPINNECNAFVKICCVSGQKTFTSAYDMRDNVNFCGNGAAYFIQKEEFAAAPQKIEQIKEYEYKEELNISNHKSWK